VGGKEVSVWVCGVLNLTVEASYAARSVVSEGGVWFLFWVDLPGV